MVDPKALPVTVTVRTPIPCRTSRIEELKLILCPETTGTIELYIININVQTFFRFRVRVI